MLSIIFINSIFFEIGLFDFFHNLLEGLSNLPSNSKKSLDSITNKNNHNL